ncbi:phage integrase family protein [Gramella sp. Hel_I_59]|uniref:tyrosine-type recombinase/integrase n=1 Tax=Gramella sp. Hel_I_59 TaxID=1249978 RepID=UPI00114F4B97|nr:site-specific integrase [Gramella sp. Hel_I_59]TQI69142.1 phage integrase family protein [Gramella sp. Hel_I_59]TQI72298.1 phage integrase family protein [Gramella sp. Hel_I_59]
MKKSDPIKVVHRNDHSSLEIFVAKKRYSKPKLFTPKVDGKPSVAPGQYWYVYFWWRKNPEGPFDYQPRFKRNLNYLKTVKERKAAGNLMAEQYHEALKKGWNPETKSISGSSRRKKIVSLKDALQYAFDIKKKGKSQPTVDGYKFHLDRFNEWSSTNGISGMDVKQFGIDHFYEFWDWLRFEYIKDDKQPLSGTSINNHKRSLSALFSTMKNERLINDNFIIGIPLEDEDPQNNKAFTPEELVKVIKTLSSDDPYMIPIVQLIFYALLRPREVLRLRIQDLNTEDWLLEVKTKTESRSRRRIIEKIKPAIQALDIKGKPGHYHVFTYWNEPGVWEPKKLKTKVDTMGRRFSEVKNKLGFGREYGLYSIRHTAIMDLYQSYLNDGLAEHEIYPKLMGHTGHRSIEGVKKYLRQYSYALPPDHSDVYSIDI